MSDVEDLTAEYLRMPVLEAHAGGAIKRIANFTSKQPLFLPSLILNE